MANFSKALLIAAICVTLSACVEPDGVQITAQDTAIVAEDANTSFTCYVNATLEHSFSDPLPNLDFRIEIRRENGDVGGYIDSGSTLAGPFVPDSPIRVAIRANQAGWFHNNSSPEEQARQTQKCDTLLNQRLLLVEEHCSVAGSSENACSGRVTFAIGQ